MKNTKFDKSSLPSRHVIEGPLGLQALKALGEETVEGYLVRAVLH